MQTVISPCYFVIFGATGNLATDKLLPSLYHLECAGRISEDMLFIATSRRPWDDQQWRDHVCETLKERVGSDIDQDTCDRFIKRFSFVSGDHADPDTYSKLMEVLSAPRNGTCENIVFYLAINPTDFLNVVSQLHQAGFSGSFARHRIVVEKPFGEDIESAMVLNRRLHEHFSEEQIYRIDHYLGKETVQNLLWSLWNLLQYWMRMPCVMKR